MGIVESRRNGSHKKRNLRTDPVHHLCKPFLPVPEGAPSRIPREDPSTSPPGEV